MEIKNMGFLLRRLLTEYTLHYGIAEERLVSPWCSSYFYVRSFKQDGFKKRPKTSACPESQDIIVLSWNSTVKSWVIPLYLLCMKKFKGKCKGLCIWQRNHYTYNKYQSSVVYTTCFINRGTQNTNSSSTASVKQKQSRLCVTNVVNNLPISTRLFDTCDTYSIFQ